MTRALAVLLLAAGPLGAGPAAGQEAASFEDLARRAAEARDADRVPEAIELYRQAVELRSDWDEGWWYFSTLLYDRDRYAEARNAFEGFLKLKPDAGPGWVLLGLCEFQIGDFVRSLEHIRKGKELGGSGEEILRVAVYHEALLLIRAGQFELAVQPLTLLARSHPESREIVEAIGLMVLRTPMLPGDVPESRRELAREAGWAGYLHLSRQGERAAAAYEELIAAHPEEPWLHYAYGVFLLSSDPERGLEQLRLEAEIQPDAFYPHLEMAFELLRQGRDEEALEAARKAVDRAPELFAAQNALGRALMKVGSHQEGVAALERAVELAPGSPEMRFSLARAYQTVGRHEDAKRERAVFAELDRERRGEPGEPESPR